MCPGNWGGKPLFEHGWALSRGSFLGLRHLRALSLENKIPQRAAGGGLGPHCPSVGQLLCTGLSCAKARKRGPGGRAGVRVAPKASYLIEVSHIFTVLQHPGVEGLPWVGKEDKKRGSDLSTWHSP